MHLIQQPRVRISALAKFQRKVLLCQLSANPEQEPRSKKKWSTLQKDEQMFDQFLTKRKYPEPRILLPRGGTISHQNILVCFHSGMTVPFSGFDDLKNDFFVKASEPLKRFYQA